MPTKPYRILACLATAVALAAVTSPALAGHWGSTFDPIGMHGTDLIDISGSDCLPGTTSGGFFYVNGFGTNNCIVSLLNADVTLTSVPETTDTAHITFSDIGSITSGNIWGVDLAADGTLLGVDSFPIGPEFPAGDFNPIFAGPWWIQLDAGDGQTPPGFAAVLDPPLTNTVMLLGGTCFELEGCSPDTQPTYTANVVGNRFFAVPEPGSLGLLLGALGAGWLARRRKARR